VTERADVPDRPRRVLRWPTFAMGQLYRAAHARISADLAEVDESLSTYYVLATLSEYGELSQQQVCDHIEMDRSDMVRLIDGLEGRGHVLRGRDPHDRRRYRLTLTASGRTALQRCEEILAAATDDVFANLSGDERRSLHRLTLRALGEPEDVPGPTARRRTPRARSS
jgi:MarR family transcriptional regulator, lower aerobic nicotinate degradation pathway regulator